MEDEPSYRALANDSGVNASEFWKKYADQNLTGDFCTLVGSMLALEPTARPSMVDFLGSPWMRGEVVTEEVFVSKVKSFM